LKSATHMQPHARTTLRVLALTFGVVLFAASMFAQSNLGRIIGLVTDQTGAVLPGATVSITDTERGTTRTLTTDGSGQYIAPSLIPGNYTVKVEAKGFKIVERPNVQVVVGRDIRVDVTPQPGDQTQTITVTESIPLVDATSATLGGAMSNAEINDLPLNGRNYQNLLGLRPGVMLQAGGSPWTQSTNNIRPDETVWMLDGIINVNFYDARPLANMPSPFTDMATILPIDAIQEFNVQENPKAEFGWKSGAVVNVGVKSGTNTLHGSAYAFGRKDSWDARNVFNPPPNEVLPTALEQFGGVAGGAIKKDKIFFFGGYEGIKSLVGNAFGTTIPATSLPAPDPANSMQSAIQGLNSKGIPLSALSLQMLGCTNAGACTGGYLPNLTTNSFVSTLPNDNKSNNYIGKIDYNLNDKNRFNVFALIGRYFATGIDHPAMNQLWTNNLEQNIMTINGNWVYTPTSRLVNEVRYSYNQMDFLFDPSDQATLADGKGYPINTGAPEGGFPSIYMKGFASQNHGQFMGSTAGRPTDNTPNPYWDLQDSVSLQVGKHGLKFGGEYAHIQGNANSHDQRGRIKFNGNQAFAGATPLEDFFAGLPTNAQLLSGVPKIVLRWHSLAGFIQDDWRLTPRLTLNLGMRWAFVTPMKEIDNKIGTFLPSLGLVQQGQSGYDTLTSTDKKNPSPRIGFAYDVNGKGTTVVRGGLGVIYSTFAAANFVGNPTANNVPGGLSLATVPTGACMTAVAVGVPCPQTYGGTISAAQVTVPGAKLNWNGVVYPQGISAACTADSPCNAGSIDPNLKNPYVVNWNFGIQHSFANDYSVDIAYVGNLGKRQIGIVDINQANPATGVLPLAAKYPYIGFVNQTQNYAHSNYNSLQSTLTKRLSHGVNFTAGYTYGHGLDNGSLSRFAGLPQDSTNPIGGYGSSDYDTRHRFTFQTSYALPSKKGYGQILEGWKVNAIINLATGQPWLAVDTGNNFSNTNESADRWDFFGNPKDFVSSSSSLPYCTGPTSSPGVGGCSVTSGVSGIQSYFSVGDSTAMWAKCTAVSPDQSTLGVGGCYVKGNSVMVPPKFGTFGTMGRNTFYDPGFKNLDFSLFKDFHYKERMKAQFRVEIFNLFNHPNLANPYGGVVNSGIGDDPSATGSFGCGCGTPDIINGNPILGSGGAREMQLGLKFTF